MTAATLALMDQYAAALYRMDEWYSRRGLATQWMGW